ncbi:uncharacterized protein B0I36DRAFT_333647 [Microdochium trichocladiopsis]|uniref:Uncharacterized protein n=1 Tax=Microdochium trichocladiopsis TaxID=1682393 RepID=A0A9P8XW72_9PEZI|nr:uncharacterized protein B0I36DRAFT_333647 [Microdochium trichocladiopsis]KAH7021036.1 hypothetical protein B0I36DRAFT_333647 [Microdochium trichocladiopsis]
MASHLCSTPPPPGSVRTPDTPKHGYSDSWEPFSPRKSARISEKRASARTPSPNTTTHKSASRKPASNIFSTPATSPQKRRLPAMDSVRRAPNTCTAEAPTLAGHGLPIPLTSSSYSKSKTGSASISRVGTMLPTPAKTPRKQPNENDAAAVRSVARNLFSAESDMIASPRKRKAKKYSGIAMESFVAEDIEQPIPIFTDSRDRIPSIDRSSANPFYANNAAAHDSDVAFEPETAKRRSRRRQVTIPGEGSQTVEEAVQRDDGIVYVFRGKKIFRKFSDSQDGRSSALAAGDDEMSLEAAADEETPRRLTRSAIKPRLLFPPRDKAPATEEDDEEAVTDIEDNGVSFLNAATMPHPETPAEAHEDNLKTPKAPRFAPASPPSTIRTTRTTSKDLANESPLKRPIKSGSPFDSWRVSKRTSGRTSLKREGEPLESSLETSKRQRA